MSIVYISIGGFFGAIIRFAVTNYAKRKTKSDMPLGTIAVNFVGAFLIGLFLKLSLSGSADALLIVGFLGAFTTFSKIMLEMVQMLDAGKKKTFFAYFFVSFVGGVFCTFIGVIVSIYFLNV